MTTAVPDSKPRALVVIVRGWTSRTDWLVRLAKFWDRVTGRPDTARTGELPDAFIDFVQRTLGTTYDVQILAPNDLPMGMFSTARPEAIVEDLLRRVRLAVRENLPDRIYLIGYSTGAVLARALFCAAHGADDEAKVVNAEPWASCIRRVIYISAITRGWEISSATPVAVRAVAPLLLGAASVRGFLRRLRSWPGLRNLFGSDALISCVKRGSPFVTLTQLQFLAVHRKLQERADRAGDAQELPAFVYLLGSKDEFVSPADAMDYGPLATSVYLEVPDSTHVQLVTLEPSGPITTVRQDIIRSALLDSTRQLRHREYVVHREDVDDYVDELDRPEPPTTAREFVEVERAVMIVHGIRDNGFWTKRVARAVRRHGKEAGLNVRAPTPSYGFFSALDFIRPNGRLSATYWFLEKYVQVRAVYPNARISFIGHSNGTFLATRAMELCRAVEFDHIVLAGSVVRSNFEWRTYLRSRVDTVLNVTGSRDMVVRMLPGLVERLGLSFMQCGGAGYFGFKDFRRISDTRHVAQVQVEGGHGAGISEPYWDRLAKQALHGRFESVAELPPTAVRPAVLYLVRDLLFAVVVLGAVLALLCLLARWLLPAIVTVPGAFVALVSVLILFLLERAIRLL